MFPTWVSKWSPEAPRNESAAIKERLVLTTEICALIRGL